MNKIILILSAFIIVFTGCRTNNLENYDLNRKKIFFEEVVASDARRVEIHNDTPPSSSEKKKSTGEKIADIAVSIGNIIVSSDAEDKLIRAVNPDSVAFAVSDGVSSTLRKYLMVEPVWKLDDDVEFVATVTIEEIQLRSTSGALSIRVQAKTLITSRLDGEVVWENREAETYPLRRSFGGSEESAIGRTIQNALQATELASLSEEQLRFAVSDAAKKVGIEMAETLRKDIAKAKRKTTG